MSRVDLYCVNVAVDFDVHVLQPIMCTHRSGFLEMYTFSPIFRFACIDAMVDMLAWFIGSADDFVV